MTSRGWMALLCLSIVSLSIAAQEFPVSRLAQLQLGHALFSNNLPHLFTSGTNASVKVGSQRAGFAGGGAVPAAPGSLRRSVVLLLWTELTEQVLQDLTDRQADSILIILPDPTIDKETNTESVQRTLEHFLLSKPWDASIYFVFDNEKLRTIRRDVVAASTGTASSFSPARDHWHFVVSANEPHLIIDIPITNIQGLLRGSVRNGPTIAITTYYDTFSAAPGLSGGVDSNGSGLVALLELTRLFSKLYNRAETRPAYNLLFVLTGGSRLNHAGTRHWISTADSTLLESVSFVLCLDTLLGAGEGLQLHVSRVSRDDNIKDIYESFNTTAAALNIPFAVTQRKINVSDPAVYWQHELFSIKRKLAGTLSSFTAPPTPLTSSNIGDRRVTVSSLLLKIKFVAEAVANFLYRREPHGVRPLDLFRDDLAPSQHFVGAWLQLLLREPLVQAYLPKESPVIADMFQVVKSHTDEALTLNFVSRETEPETGYYSNIQANMSVSRVKPTSFDVLFLLAVAAYLSLFYAVIKGPSEFIKEVKQFVSPAPKRFAPKKKA